MAGEQAGQDQTSLRSEAAPIRNIGNLTQEQHDAGAQATRLLREMSSRPWRPTQLPPDSFSFLPVIEEERQSRVVLLDGARGSGKSALLLTLLDGYNRTLIDRKPPAGYEPWMQVESKVVPVGHIDLQPLPESTNLFFLLAACLERVVRAMRSKRELRPSGTPPWHLPESDELSSQRYWRHFARIAASGWQSNLPERKGSLDTEAFAIELEHEEYRRLDLLTAFRQFVDALVKDYQSWSKWDNEVVPLFLLAIDDADMNPQLSGSLLELIRKLYHPRLAFIVTGDSKLFVQMLRMDLVAQVQRRAPGALVPTQEVTNMGGLAQEIYEKVIPIGHRCALPPIPVERRQKVVPELNYLLQALTLSPREDLGIKRLTLHDYLERFNGAKAVLPERLRQLWELHGLFTNVLAETERKGLKDEQLPRAVEKLWSQALDSSQLSPETRDLLAPVVRNREGRLQVMGRTRLVPTLEERRRLTFAPTWQLVVEVPLQFTAVVQQRNELMRGSTGVNLDERIVSALMLATNIAADDTRGEFVGSPPRPGFLQHPLLAHVEGTSVDGARVSASWPLPEWDSFVDIMDAVELWRFATSRTPQALVDKIARRFLGIILRVGTSKRWSKRKTPSPKLLSWEDLAAWLVQVSLQSKQTSRRARVLAEWAHGHAGLLAAPESGLPASSANHFLQALQNAFGQGWDEVKNALRRSRLMRLNVFDIPDGYEQVSTAYWCQRIDETFPGHRFQYVVEDKTTAKSEESQRNAANIRNALGNIRVQWLSSTVGTNRDSTLEIYVSDYRNEWLKEASLQLQQVVHTTLGAFTSTVGLGTPPLAAVWRNMALAVGSPTLEELIQQDRADLEIQEPLQDSLHRKIVHPVLEQRVFTIHRGDEFTIDIKRRADMGTRVLTGHADPAFEVFLRIAFDHGRDVKGRLEILPIQDLCWVGATFRFRKFTYHPWPVPAWPTLLEWELLEPVWNARVAGAQLGVGQKEAKGEHPYVDALAHWLIQAQHMLSLRQKPMAPLALVTAESEWARVARRYWEAQKPVHLSHENVYARWLEQIILMAAPEAGLSRDASSALLEALIHPETGKEIVAAQDRIALMRRGRMVSAGLSPEQVDEFLVQMDSAHRGHPWHRIFGQWKPESK